jgi:UDP-N-acetyl-D-glucosamine/UDP-N-acetyl-D-galactosamine dehydrogenase
VVKCMIKKNININGAKVLILGITFKENCPDVRNTKVVDVVNALKGYSVDIKIYDPWANEEEVKKEYGLVSNQEVPKEQFDAIVLTVAHREFESLNINQLKFENAVVYDVKNSLSREVRDSSL